MATMKAKQNARKAGTVSVTLTNHSPLFATMFEHGEKAGIGQRAKLDAALDFQRMVKDGEVDTSTDELKTAAIADAAHGYDAGMAKALGREPSSAESLKTLRAEFGTFIRADVLTHADSAYKLIADAVKGKTSKEVIADAYQQRVNVNRLVDKAKGVPTKAAVAEKLSKGDDDTSPADKAKAQLKSLIKMATALSKAKAGVPKATKAALIELLTVLA